MKRHLLQMPDKQLVDTVLGLIGRQMDDQRLSYRDGAMVRYPADLLPDEKKYIVAIYGSCRMKAIIDGLIGGLYCGMDFWEVIPYFRSIGCDKMADLLVSVTNVFPTREAYFNRERRVEIVETNRAFLDECDGQYGILDEYEIECLARYIRQNFAAFEDLLKYYKPSDIGTEDIAIDDGSVPGGVDTYDVPTASRALLPGSEFGIGDAIRSSPTVSVAETVSEPELTLEVARKTGLARFAMKFKIIRTLVSSASGQPIETMLIFTIDSKRGERLPAKGERVILFYSGRQLSKMLSASPDNVAAVEAEIRSPKP